MPRQTSIKGPLGLFACLLLSSLGTALVAHAQELVPSAPGVETPAAAIVVEPPPIPVAETPPVPVAETPPIPAAETPPIPVVETPPIPVVETPPVPVVETPPVPVVETPPIPVVETPTVPVVETPPIPAVEAPPTPVIETPPIPVVEAPPIPAAETPPIPVAETPPIPVAETPPIPVVETPPIPAAETPPIPVVETPPTPVVETPPSPVVETPLIPVVATPPIPVAETPPIPVVATPPIPAPIVPAPIVPAPRPTVPHSMYEGRPASVPINSIEIQGVITATDPALRPWSERITPVSIRYPGIDLASALFQDKAAGRFNAFNKWIAEKWIDRNARCNNVFQRDPRTYPWDIHGGNVVPQCAELNRPAKDLVPSCQAPTTTHYGRGILRLRWLCTLADGTVPMLYEEAIPSPHGGAFAAAVNPASKVRSRIPIEMLDVPSNK